MAAKANDPNRSIAEVARGHDLGANMVAQWRRSSLEAQRALRHQVSRCCPLMWSIYVQKTPRTEVAAQIRTVG
ncbi:hypothetical protein [Burkholderia oklahomensis]|uniref:hypothetical protein n=1 Tax=Burkholderia oklahomensis TaxID=342113 RepID=UPI0009D99FA1|nr:hypothetical protein [Burkholderia oklahomensis]QPS40791.1 hypothetical protein I6G57_21035 [Burkholderia oklahomensis]